MGGTQAERWIDNPNDPTKSSFDCSSFTDIVWREVYNPSGPTGWLGWNTDDQIDNPRLVKIGSNSNPGQGKPGDLVYWRPEPGKGHGTKYSHVGIISAPGKVIDCRYLESNPPASGVAERNMFGGWYDVMRFKET